MTGFALAACQPASPGGQFGPAPAQSLAQLTPSPLDFVPPGTTLIWQDIQTGQMREEHVLKPDGRLYQSSIGNRRSFYYPPDPWADNENTDPADMDALFPLHLGSKAVFNRHPELGKVTDTVEVVRVETLQLAMGPVDTFVIETESKAIDGSWQGHATEWYAPSLHAVVQVILKDSDGDNRARKLIEIRKPTA